MFSWLSWVALVFLALWGREQPQAKLHRANHDRQPAQRKQPVRPLEPVPPQGWHPQEEKHRRREGWYWFFSIFLSLAVAIGAGFSARYAYRAASEAHRQADIAQNTLVASSRPWVMLVEVTPTSLTSDDEAGVGFWADFIVKNVGHSAAQNVTVSGQLLIDQFDPEPEQVMINVCAEVRKNPIIPGQVVFPDQRQNIYEDTPEGFLIAADKVWDARAARINSAYDPRGIGRSPERAKELVDALARFPFYAALYLVGCVSYYGIDEGAIHQTSFAFEVIPNREMPPFPLLSGVAPKVRYPALDPSNPDTVNVFPRKLQRMITGDQIKLGVPLYGQIAN